jgi:hypothetical protein
MEVKRPDGTVSPREWATIVRMGEGATRVALREGRLTASTDENRRRWISEVEISKRFALELTSTVKQAATLATLRRNEAAAGVTLGPDEELVRNAELFLSAANDEPTPETDPWVEHNDDGDRYWLDGEPVKRQSLRCGCASSMPRSSCAQPICRSGTLPSTAALPTSIISPRHSSASHSSPRAPTGRPEVTCGNDGIPRHEGTRCAGVQIGKERPPATR